MSTKKLISVVKHFFEQGDLHGGLKYLNSLTPHRFSAIYFVGLDDSCLNMYGVDKTDPTMTSLPDVPGTASYCAFTRRRRKTLAFADATEVADFDEHPAREEVRSYCAVPILDLEGNVIGTVCHFDYSVMSVSEETVELLEAAADIFRYLPVEVYAERASRTVSIGEGFKSSMTAR